MAAHPSKKAKKTAKSNETREKLTELNKQLKEGGVSAALQYLRDMTALFAKAARRVLRAIVIDRMEAALVIATEDAAQTATEYGKACAVVYPVQALLESTFRVRRRRVEITPDFLAEQGRIFLDLRLHALPARLLWAGLRLLGGFLVHTIRNRPSA